MELSVTKETKFGLEIHVLRIDGRPHQTFMSSQLAITAMKRLHIKLMNGIR